MDFNGSNWSISSTFTGADQYDSMEWRKKYLAEKASHKEVEKKFLELQKQFGEKYRTDYIFHDNVTKLCNESEEFKTFLADFAVVADDGKFQAGDLTIIKEKVVDFSKNVVEFMDCVNTTFAEALLTRTREEETKKDDLITGLQKEVFELKEESKTMTAELMSARENVLRLNETLELQHKFISEMKDSAEKLEESRAEIEDLREQLEQSDAVKSEATAKIAQNKAENDKTKSLKLQNFHRLESSFLQKVQPRLALQQTSNNAENMEKRGKPKIAKYKKTNMDVDEHIWLLRK